MRTRLPLVPLVFATALTVAGCGFTGASQVNPPEKVSVTISPQSAIVMLGGTVQFTATVTGASSSMVNWSVNGAPGGSAIAGAISNAGLYTAPTSMPAASTVTVTATAQGDPRASGSAIVQIQSGITVSISPNAANVPPGGTQNFSAMVNGGAGANSTVNWNVKGVSGGNAAVGAISPMGGNSAMYTAPDIPPTGTVTVIAASVADPSKSASASVTVSCAASNSIAPLSASVAAGTTQNFTDSLCVAPGTPITWEVNGIAGGSAALGTIAANAANAGTYTAPASVPASNSVTIQAVAGTQNASASVTIVGTPAISVIVSPASAGVDPGTRATFTASVSGSANAAVTWSVDGIANGNPTVGQICAPTSNPCASPTGTQATIDYFAPQILPQPSTVALTATSAADTTTSGSARITITPPALPGMTVAPFYAFLGPSQQFHFAANVTGVADTVLTWTVTSAVGGQGCAGAACGSIDNAGNYIAPALAPSPNAIRVKATSAANPALSATATVAITSGPTIETVFPSSVVAGAQQAFELTVKGLNFAATTATSSSQILLNNSPRATNCPTPNQCTITVQPFDVDVAGALTVQIQDLGAPAALSNPVSLVVLPAPAPPNPIALTAASPLAANQDITVPEPSTAGATTSPVSVDFVGIVSANSSTCTIQTSPIEVTRPASGTASVNICVQGNFLDPTFAYTFTASQTGGDIGITTASMASLFPNLIELTLTISSQTAPGVRTLFITTPNGDIATATGVLEVK